VGKHRTDHRSNSSSHTCRTPSTYGTMSCSPWPTGGSVGEDRDPPQCRCRTPCSSTSCTCSQACTSCSTTDKLMSMGAVAAVWRGSQRTRRTSSCTCRSARLPCTPSNTMRSREQKPVAVARRRGSQSIVCRTNSCSASPGCNSTTHGRQVRINQSRQEYGWVYSSSRQEHGWV
jgi:hypothetical protein